VDGYWGEGVWRGVEPQKGHGYPIHPNNPHSTHYSDRTTDHRHDASPPLPKKTSPLNLTTTLTHHSTTAMSLLPPTVLATLSSQARSGTCAFCEISSTYPPFPPSSPAPASPPAPPQQQQSHIVLSTPDVIAFLDILPLTRAHVLVCPRAHHEKLSDLSPAENAVVGAWLPVVARAACRVSGYADFNLVQNNGMFPACEA